MSTPRRLVLFVTVALVAAWITAAIAAYPTLPDRIPTHFGPSGVADHYSQRSVASWFLLPLIGTATAALVVGLAGMVHRRPDLFNVAEKATLLALPHDLRAPLLEEMGTQLSGLGAGIVVLFATIHADTWRAAVYHTNALSPLTWVVMGLVLVGSTLGILLWQWRFARRIREAAAQAQARSTTHVRTS